MNKFTKVILILAASLFGIGIVCTIAAFIMGASFSNLRDVGGYINHMDDFEVKVSGELSEMSSFEGIKNISLEVGASAIDISYADVEQVEVRYEDAVGMDMDLDDEELDIECRASGDVEILIPEGTQLDSIDLDIGAGQVMIHDIFFRNLDADIGAGELIIQAPEAKNAYNYNVDCALGEVCIGDETYAGISSTDKNQGGNRYMDIDCGAGRVEIQFAE